MGRVTRALSQAGETIERLQWVQLLHFPSRERQDYRLGCLHPWSKPLFNLLEPQSRSGDKPLKFLVVCPLNGTAVLKGLMTARDRPD